MDSHGAALVGTHNETITCKMIAYMLEKSYDSCVVILHTIC